MSAFLACLPASLPLCEAFHCNHVEILLHCQCIYACELGALARSLLKAKCMQSPPTPRPASAASDTELKRENPSGLFPRLQHSRLRKDRS